MESNLLSLRSELLKKRDEANKQLRDQKSGIHKKLPFEKSRKELRHNFGGSNKNVSERVAKDLESKVKDDEVSAEKAKSILEQKAALYDKLKSGIKALDSDEINERFLVNFQEKIIQDVSIKKNENKEDDDEWIEYIDVLGRARMCHRDDLEEMKKQDDYLRGDKDKPDANKALNEVKRHQLLAKWDQIEEETKAKNNVHYQDVMFDEARSHGAAYMPFSRDEGRRKEEKELLARLHFEGMKGEEEHRLQKRRKERLLERRLRKVRQRKRLKMGLPCEAPEDNLELPSESDGEEERIQEEMKRERKEELKKEEEEEKRKNEELRAKKVREWDLGKDGVKMSQEEWLESRRKERDNEFAPPASFCSESIDSTNSGPSTIKSTTFNSSTCYPSSSTMPKSKEAKYESARVNELRSHRVDEFAPPPVYEYYGPTLPQKSYKNKTNETFNKDFNEGIENLMSFYRKKS